MIGHYIKVLLLGRSCEPLQADVDFWRAEFEAVCKRNGELTKENLELRKDLKRLGASLEEHKDIKQEESKQ